ncbi:uncharacterized protein EV154DRAFT_250404 [Mucor mucedo]|uniref:uncharacterized protein n=1 Tax=Mucor mucedo TaxID=29922 RepID=UPI0022209F46|nr:uncharacterized protein EV154DRAFT_250404 [Mucor mucedo]KAI7890560.1 hypothetical protein EV154DRAFT_250404 [Mucor mucedo]
MDLSISGTSQQQLPLATLLPPNAHYHSDIVSSGLNNNKNTIPERIASYERIPTSTWGPFTIVVVVFLVIFTCFILNCSRIRRSVGERKMDRLGRSGTFKKRSFERRHKDLQEADLEWNNNPPMVYEEKQPTTPESVHCSKNSTLSSSAWSSHSTLAAAQSHHYNDINFIRNQPPGVQLRLTLENASSSSLITEPNMAYVSTNSSKSSKSSSRSVIPHQSNLQTHPNKIGTPSTLDSSKKLGATDNTSSSLITSST